MRMRKAQEADFPRGETGKTLKETETAAILRVHEKQSLEPRPAVQKTG